jgi:hypothetical protein
LWGLTLDSQRVDYLPMENGPRTFTGEPYEKMPPVCTFWPRPVFSVQRLPEGDLLGLFQWLQMQELPPWLAVAHIKLFPFLPSACGGGLPGGRTFVSAVFHCAFRQHAAYISSCKPGTEFRGHPPYRPGGRSTRIQARIGMHMNTTTQSDDKGPMMGAGR